MTSGDIIILSVGALVAGSCALVGSFLVLRRMALLGDAISHAVLPGIVLAFLFSGSRTPLPMLIGASLLGVTTVFLVERLNRTKRLYEDASIGVVFPALFSIGVILISRYASQVHLDVDCVLFGEIGHAALDLLEIGGQFYGPKALWVVGAVFIFNLALILAFYKELKITTFDPELAQAIGISPTVMHYIFMSAVSITVVACFESVGAILVVAMLVVPPAAAYLLTDRLSVMITLAVGLSVVASSAGYGFAIAWDCSIAGAMAVMTGVILLASVLLSPHYGIIARAVSRGRLRLRLASELLLLHLDHGPGPEEVARRLGFGQRRMRRLLHELERCGKIEKIDGGYRRVEDHPQSHAPFKR